MTVEDRPLGVSRPSPRRPRHSTTASANDVSLPKIVFPLLVGVAATSGLRAQTNAVSDAIRKMAEPDRVSALTEFLRQSGESCDVTRTFYQGANESGDAFWNVACRIGVAFAIMINADAGGTTRVLDCSAMKEITSAECFRSFED